MNTKAGHFTPSEHDALLLMRELSGGQVLPCVFPSNLKTATYYISEFGDLFTVSKVADHYVVYGPKKDKTMYIKAKNRRDGGVTYTMNIEATRKQLVAAEKLVYCTFILKQWVFEDIKIQFKDGNVRNIRLKNLFAKDETWQQGWTERMNEFADTYMCSFRKVVCVVRHRCFMSEADAEDIAQSTFIYLMQRKDGPFTEAIWIYWAKRYGWRKRTRYDKKNCLVGDFYDCAYSAYDRPYEVDLLHSVKGKDREYAQLWMNGVRPQEIARIYRKDRLAISAGIGRAKRIVKKELHDERELLGY